MDGNERWMRETLHRLLDDILDAQYEIAFDHYGPQGPPLLWGHSRSDFWANVATHAENGRSHLLRRATLEHNPAATLKEMRHPSIANGHASSESELRSIVSAEVLSVAIEQLLKAFAPSFNAYAIVHAQILAQRAPIVDARVWDYICAGR
jgi:hypothetical protein